MVSGLKKAAQRIDRECRMVLGFIQRRMSSSLIGTRENPVAQFGTFFVAVGLAMMAIALSGVEAIKPLIEQGPNAFCLGLACIVLVVVWYLIFGRPFPALFWPVVEPLNHAVFLKVVAQHSDEFEVQVVRASDESKEALLSPIKQINRSLAWIDGGESVRKLNAASVGRAEILTLEWERGTSQEREWWVFTVGGSWLPEEFSGHYSKVGYYQGDTTIQEWRVFLHLRVTAARAEKPEEIGIALERVMQSNPPYKTFPTLRIVEVFDMSGQPIKPPTPDN